MRLVDADKLHKAIDTETYRHTYIEQIHSIIDNAPTIDAEPVVRCKDCKHRHEYRNSEYIDCDCTDFYEMDDNDYCCFGERREDDIKRD